MSRMENLLLLLYLLYLLLVPLLYLRRLNPSRALGVEMDISDLELLAEERGHR